MLQGTSALEIAIHEHNKEMVSFLLRQAGDVSLSNCALHAVRENQPSILLLLLDRLKNTDPALEFEGCPGRGHFPDYMTPLILAAQCGNYEITGLLLQRGHRIEHPHHPTCYCSVCRFVSLLIYLTTLSQQHRTEQIGVVITLYSVDSRFDRRPRVPFPDLYQRLQENARIMR